MKPKKRIRLLKTGTSHLSALKFIAFIKHICKSLKTGEGSKVFGPTITDFVPELELKLGTYWEAYQMPDSTYAAELRASIRESIVGDIIVLAGRIEDVCDGDLVMLAASGFEIKKTGSADSSHLLAPMNVRCRHGLNSGHLQVLCNAVKRSKVYFVQYRLDDGAWSESIPFTNSREMIVSGLIPGSTYTFRVMAQNSFTKTDWTVSGPIICL